VTGPIGAGDVAVGIVVGAFAATGLLFRPIVTQVSRWDRLKGYLPLLRAFVALKEDPGDLERLDEIPRRTLELVRLVLAGPDPRSIQDDPEAEEVLDEICEEYVQLPEAMRDDIAVITLPMASGKENALLVNALHRCSDVVVQNSLQEGFGLTATEAMWKSVAVVGSRAAGLRQQIRPGLNGCIVDDPRDPQAIARVLSDLLRNQKTRETLGANAQRSVHDEFLVFSQVRRWLELLADTAERH
jgi:trehalose synthase